MERFVQDVRIGARSLRRSPGFAAITILTLALSVGLSTAVFTVADALLLRPLPVRDQAELVMLTGERRDGSFANFPLGLENARLGIGAGLLGAIAANRLLAAMLFEVSPTDAATLAAVAALLFGIAIQASLIPARASARIHPAVALRAE